MTNRKLQFELVPEGCWGSNLRAIFTKKQWDFIRNDAKQRANGHCQICGKKTDRLDAHERWIYDEQNAVQILDDVICVCKDCHNTIHIGRTQLKGNVIRAENHYIKVNGCTYAQMIEDLREANVDHQRRNKISEWKLDLSWLKKFIND